MSCIQTKFEHSTKMFLTMLWALAAPVLSSDKAYPEHIYLHVDVHNHEEDFHIARNFQGWYSDDHQGDTDNVLGSVRYGKGVEYGYEPEDTRVHLEPTDTLKQWRIDWPEFQLDPYALDMRFRGPPPSTEGQTDTFHAPSEFTSQFKPSHPNEEEQKANDDPKASKPARAQCGSRFEMGQDDEAKVDYPEQIYRIFTPSDIELDYEAMFVHKPELPTVWGGMGPVLEYSPQMAALLKVLDIGCHGQLPAQDQKGWLGGRTSLPKNELDWAYHKLVDLSRTTDGGGDVYSRYLEGGGSDADLLNKLERVFDPDRCQWC